MSQYLEVMESNQGQVIYSLDIERSKKQAVINWKYS